MAEYPQGICDLVLKIGDHFKSNINNTYIHPFFNRLTIGNSEWSRLGELTEIQDLAHLRAFSFLEMYERVMALAHFIRQVKDEVIPTLPLTGGARGTEVLRSMAISNLKPNLNALADMVNDLYLQIVEFDKESHSSKPPVFTRVPELRTIGEMLVD